MFSNNNFNVQYNRIISYRNLNGFHILQKICKTPLNTLHFSLVIPDVNFYDYFHQCDTTYISVSCYLCCFPSKRARENNLQLVSTRLKGTPSRSEQEDTKDIPLDWRRKMPKEHPNGERNEVSKMEGSREKWD